MAENLPYVSNIQRFSVDDGPGIRTTVFFKGCNLHCAWCHNPECIIQGPTLQFLENSCTICGRCVETCKQGVHSIDAEGRHLLDRTRCICCGECAYNCPHTALSIIGRQYMPEELLKELEKDKKYYETSGGGVTFSGGEPLLQKDYLTEILKLCKSDGFNTAVDTAGCVPFSAFETVMPWTDLFLYDIKLMDDERHKAATGVSNRLILENLDRLTCAGADVYIRTPIIPTYNDDLEDLGGIAAFLASLPGREHVRLIQLLPYHNYGVGKYASIGSVSKTMDVVPPTGEFMQLALQKYLDQGLPAQIS